MPRTSVSLFDAAPAPPPALEGGGGRGLAVQPRCLAAHDAVRGALTVLQRLLEHAGPWPTTAMQVAQRMGWSLTTAQSVLVGLEALGIFERQ